MSQVGLPQSARSGRQSTNSGQSSEKLFGDNIFELKNLKMERKDVSCKDGVCEYYQMTQVLFKDEDDQKHSVEFRRIVRLDEDVPQMPKNGQFSRHQVVVDVQEYRSETGCRSVTEIKRRVNGAGGRSGSRRTCEEQIWKLVDEGMRHLVQHFCEDYADWKPISDADNQQTTDGMHRSDDLPHQYAREEAGKTLHAEVNFCYTSQTFTDHTHSHSQI